VKILIVDDDPGLRKSLGMLLAEDGYDVVAEERATSALERLRSEAFDAVLCDVRMPEMDGLTFLRTYRERGGTALVVMMSAYGGEDAAIAAMKEGAYDYLPKPFRPDEVRLTLRKAEERERLRVRVADLEAEVARLHDRAVVAASAPMRHVLHLAARVAPHPTTVLVTGESGTGKEVVARAIHRMSPRRDRAFVGVNCAAIPEQLLESELFGHARGAFTGAVNERRGLFEEADGGTLLLDEIGELPASLQAKLLRVLQEGTLRRVGETRERRVDVRLIAATARDLAAEVAAGRFREDLFYRLNVVHVAIPPLRERPEDVEELAAVLLERASARAGRRLRFGPGAMASLRARSWPGNVRELENVIERAVVLARGDVLDAESLTEPPARAGPVDRTGTAATGPLRGIVADAERAAILRALEQAGGNRAAAAKLLDVSQRTLYYKMRTLNVE
jgi:two-component system, NtrC family, response regulator AtoC